MKKNLLLFSLLSLLCLSLPQFVSAQLNEYTTIEGSTTIYIQTTGTVSDFPDLWYSLDGGDWIQVTQGGTRIDVQGYSYSHPLTGYVRFKGNNPTGFNHSSTDYVSIAVKGGNPALKGNVMSLIGGDNFSQLTTIPCDYCFYALFCPSGPTSFTTSISFASTGACSNLKNAKDFVLPATELKAYCYAYMFALNSGLADAPALPATVMKPWCYAHMFDYCINSFCGKSSGAAIPTLPAQELAEGCYAYMFSRCGSLYNDNENYYILPAEELAPKCYMGMFSLYGGISGGTSLKYVEIMATSLKDRCGEDITNCCAYMFNNAIWAGTTNGRQSMTLRMYWTDWGNSTTGPNNADASANAPTYGWFYGYVRYGNTFLYQDGLTPITKNSKYGTTYLNHTFPQNATLTATNYTYLTFDCKTNGGTWEQGCEYNADLRRVVRSDYKAKTVPAAPVKAGETFKGWYTQPTGGTKAEEATILNQTTAQTYYAQFGDGNDNGGDNPQDGDDNETNYTLNLATGVLDFPQYTTYSNTSKFAVIGETENMTIRLQFTGNIMQAVSSYKDFASALSTADSYVEMKDGTRRAVTSAQKASLLYYGDYLRAAHLTATFYDADNRTYNLDIYTNELLNYATFEQDYRYAYYKTTLPVESGWVNGRSFQYNETNHLPGDENHAELNTTSKYWRYFYGSSSPFDYCQILINFIVADNEQSIPTGYYPINSTMMPGTVFIGSIPCGDNAEIARSNNRNYACGGNASWIMHYFEDEYGIPTKDNWLLRGGYVQLVNKNGSYYMHVHATTDATRTNGESSNNVIDFTVGDESLAGELPGPDDNPGGDNGGDNPDNPDDGDNTEIVSEDANVSVYQNVSKTTTKILYNLDLRQGKDGLWYKPTDMGYGIAWADRNVGAASVSATGDYYNWSKTEPGPLPLNSTGYSGGSVYVGFILPAANDVATVKMGKDWHTPSYDEWNVLLTIAKQGNNRLNNPDDESLYIPTPPTGYYDYYTQYGGLTPVNPWLNNAGSAFLWTSEVLQLNAGDLNTTNIGMATNVFDGNVELTVGYIHLAAPVRAVYTPPFTTHTLTIHVGNYDYHYVCQHGQKVTVTAIATKEGSEFIRWEEDGLTDAVRTFTVNTDMTYTAIFTENDTPDNPETPDMSPDAEVSVYQSVTKSTMKILYDLSPKQGNDGLWYTPVDLGYGVAWADRNVGASSPNAIGDYFRWGDPVAGTSFSSDHQRNLDVTGYQTYDRLTDTQDAAIVNMGNKWRMPDEEDFYQLKEQAVITNNNTFTNKDDNSLSILLPAGGYKGSKLYDQGYQYYWSRQYSNYGRNDCSSGMGYSYEEHSCFALVRSAADNKYYVNNKDKDDCFGNEPYLGMPVRALYVPPFEVCTLTINVEGYQYVYLCQTGQNVTVTAIANEGYEFDRWTEDGNTEAVRTFSVTSNMTYTATFKQAKQEYNIIYKDKGGATFSGTHASGYPTVHTYGTATALKSATKEGYNFLGWFTDINCTGTAVTSLGATAYTSDITLYAAWEEVKPDEPDDPVNDDELHIILYEDKEPDYYTDFSNKYNGKRATTVTYNRQFEQSKWSTMCLPMNVNTAILTTMKMTTRVYEFKYTKGDEESGLTLYFAQAKTLEAGKGYIVNANATLAQKTQFVFPNVVINTEADINSGFDLTNLEGYNTQGNVYLVGTLRTGLLVGSQTGNRYMGLKNNKIYYPNAEEGTNLRAYRGIFRSSVDINAQKVRIVVEGEDGEQVSELEVVNGELQERADTRKFIRNGILYIERNGRLYTAQGAVVE